MENDAIFEFSNTEEPSGNENKSHLIYVVDDDEGVLKTTRDAFEFYTYLDTGIELKFFRSAAATIDALKMDNSTNTSVAIIILDVVMEDTGFEVIDFLRNEKGNEITQIILRTGQAGKEIQEEHLITEKYKINDFIDKTESSFKRIRTAVTTSLRMFLLLQHIEKAKQDYIEELEEMLHITSHRVRKPMSSCLGLLNLLDNVDALNVTEKELPNIFSLIKKNILELDEYTRDLTNFMHQKVEVKNKP